MLMRVLALLATLLAAGSAGGEAPRPLVNDRCPVMPDEFASPTQEITFRGIAVRFCCGKCKRRFEDDPAAFVARLPQLAPEVVQAVMAESQDARRTARAEAAVDRWTRPALLTAAGAITAWLLVRIHRRRRAASASGE